MSLCERCGLCCDGTLFAFVTLTSEEASRLRARDLAVGLRDEKPVLSQHCSALVGTLCRVYEERPAACRAYECLLNKAAQEGEVGEEEAMEVVTEARRTRDPAFLRRHFLGWHSRHR